MPSQRTSRFDGFTRGELDAMFDGLMNESELDPFEDPAFPARIAVAERLLAEIKACYEMSEGS